MPSEPTLPLTPSSRPGPRVASGQPSPDSAEGLSASGHPLPPAQLGKYRLFKRLGAGMMGTVWLSHHPDLDIPVAVKTIRTDLQERQHDFVERFCREARTAARINHGNAVRIYDAGEDQGQYYLVMEYVPGGTAADLIKPSQPPLPIARALALVTGVAQALVAAAELGIVHRDIKPENIMLDEKGTPKLADLGLAKLTSESDQQLTMTGAAFGTPSYLAPEQALNARNVDIRADIYALGATFYQLLTGRLPYQADSVFHMIKQHLEAPPPDASEARPEVPRAMAAVIQKMMAKDPDDRFQTPAEVVAALQQLAGQGGTGATFLGGGRRASARPLLYAALTLLLTAGLAAFVVYTRRPTTRPVPPHPRAAAAPVAASDGGTAPIPARSPVEDEPLGGGTGSLRGERRLGPGARRPGMMTETFTRSVWRTAIRRHYGQTRVALLPEANAALTQPLADLGLTTEPLSWEVMQRDAARLASDLGLLIYTGPLPFTQDHAARLDAIAQFLASGGVFVLRPTCATGQDDLLLTQLTFLLVDGSLLPAATAATHSLRPRLPLSALLKTPVACQAASPLLVMAPEDDRGIFLTVHASPTSPSLGSAAGLIIHRREDGPPGVLAIASAPALASVDPEALLATLCLGANHALRGPDAEPLE